MSAWVDPRVAETARAILAEREALAPRLIRDRKLTQADADANLALWRQIVTWADRWSAGVPLHPASWPWAEMIAEAKRIANRVDASDEARWAARIILAHRLAHSAELNAEPLTQIKEAA